MAQQFPPGDPRAQGYPPPVGYALPPQPYGAPYGAPQGYPGGAPQGYPGAPPPQQGYGYQPGYGGAPPGYPGAPPPQQGYPGGYGGPPPQHLPQRPPAQQGYKPPAPGGHQAMDVEAQAAAAFAGRFAEAAVRKQFVKKVFTLVFLQLLVTMGVACVFMFVEPVKAYVQPGASGQWLFYAAWAVSLVGLIALMCSTTIRRKHPWNLVALFSFTLIFSVLVGCICAYWDVGVVLEAFAVTCAAVAGLTIMAIFGKFDLTKRGHILAMASGVVFMVLIVTMIVGFFYVNKWWYLAISVVCALLFSVYLVYDIQMVMGGKTFSISPDEYVFAALQIYLDVVNIFLMILNIMGIAQS